jgi:hypothetical protein
VGSGRQTGYLACRGRPRGDGLGGARRAAGGGLRGLYRVTGLEGFAPGGRPLPGDAVVFGMVGDRFVVGSSERQAREAAAMDVEAVDGAKGAAASYADFSKFPGEALANALGIATVPLGEMVAELEASTEGLEGRLRVEVPGGLP